MDQLPKIVKSRLRTAPSDHPDPDLLVAFAEGNLLTTERTNLLAHLSHCLDCRQVMELATPDRASELAPQTRLTPAWLRMPALRWGALAACAAALVAAVTLHQRPKSQAPTEIAMRTAAPTVPSSRPTAPPRQDAKVRAYSRDSVGNSGERRSAASNQLANNQPTDSLSAMAGAAPAADTNLAKQKAATSADTQLQDEAKAPARTEKAGALFTPRPTTETAASTIGGAKLTDLRAPTWRLSDDGLPERSFNSGQWEKVKVDHRSGFRALASQGMDVWLGGPAGALYHSEDMGLHWLRVIPDAAGATLTDDVTQLAFPDHLHVIVTTATGAKWSTSDAGKTWHSE
jgi:hypothetical protein